MKYLRTLVVWISALAMVATAVVPSRLYAQSSSPNYRVEESFFGTGGQVDATSSNFRARQSVGALGVGSASSNNYDAVAGFNTPNEPFLEVYVTDASVDFGDLSDTAASYGAARAEECNCSFSVRSYLTSEYAVITASLPPNYGSYYLQPKTSQGAPSTNPATEEFGINLVENTTPSLGANPKNQPDNSFADGTAAPGYNLANQYKYSLGDIIARSPSTAGNPGVGKTDYTVSYMAKIKSQTPAGTYVMRHSIIVVATF